MGVLRLYLALCVVQHHAGLSFIFLGYEVLSGHVAVKIFFVISGFYMAFILNTKYSNPEQNRLFYENRYLRLWPAYAISLLLVAGLTLWLGKVATFGQSILVDDFWTQFLLTPTAWKIYTILSNISMVGFDWHWIFAPENNQVIIVPYDGMTKHLGVIYALNAPAFTIAVELGFYLIAPFILRSFSKTLALFICALIYHVTILYFKMEYMFWNYHFFPSAYIFFAGGALAFHFSDHLLQRKKMAISFIASLLLIEVVSHPLEVVQGYLLGSIAILSTPLLFQISKNSKVDRWLGDLSYPLYIIHFPIYLYLRPYIETPWIGSYVMTISVIIAIIISLLIEAPLNHWRQSRIHNYR